ncbi:MAG: glycerol-3-phosphate 1-O-acyltransferase PlsY [Chthoniobacteraceae bacterium]|nr:glycerol-3-phosphate 1-O-acyltransferase PlsY [Chthoniobacteraceae bacterium]
MLPLFLSVLTGYLLGSFPSGFVVGKCRGINIRQHGSGNIGATNVVRTLGRKWGVLVFALDVLKGILAVRLAMLLFPSGGAGLLTELGIPPGMWAGFGCFLGHCFPVWLGFKGGKGVAVGAGILIGLTPWVAVIGLTLWGIAFKVTRYVSLASLIAAVSLPITSWALYREVGALFWFTLILSLIAIWRHRSNIQRLLAGTESRFERKK